MDQNRQNNQQPQNRQQPPQAGARQQGGAPGGDKISVKFNFESVKKFVKFEFPRKISLIELRFTFSKILDIDLYGRQLQFWLLKDNQQRLLDEIKTLTDQGLTDNEYEINVMLNDYGA